MTDGSKFGVTLFRDVLDKYPIKVIQDNQQQQNNQEEIVKTTTLVWEITV